jgi:hypothetical protein
VIDAAGVAATTFVGVVATVIAVRSSRSEQRRRERDERTTFGAGLREYITEAATAWQNTPNGEPVVLPMPAYVWLAEQASTFEPPNNSAINLMERINRFNDLLTGLPRTDKPKDIADMVATNVRPLRLGITSWISDPNEWAATTLAFKLARSRRRV